MMGWTDRHFRSFFRLISSEARLYTEMVTSAALIHGDPQRLLAYSPQEHPLALQLGGADPAELALCARMAEDWGYAEVNINVGCPSDRVQSGRFGACLMAEPGRVADCVAAMRAQVQIPVTVKCRVGIDDLDSDDYFFHFIDTVAQAGCQVFIVHARKAWLKGLSPKQNREIPELNIERVARLRALRPDLTLVLNGGIHTLEDCEKQLEVFDGVMVGRAAYHDPFLFAQADECLFGKASTALDREEMVESFCEYISRQVKTGVPLKSISRHMLNVFNGEPGARHWRRFLSLYAHKPGAGPAVVREAMSRMRAAQGDFSGGHNLVGHSGTEDRPLLE
jgi:tRNA-dihydrouridine synthase A